MRRSRPSRYDDGRFRARDTNRSFDFLELASEAARSIGLPEALKDGIAVVTDNEMHEPVFPNGTAICEVEIDPDTGAMTITRYASIDDVGRCINPLIVHGQTHGAIAQGVGQAMCGAGLSRSRFRPAADRLADGLRHAACRQAAVVRHRDRRSAVADQSARHQGRRRRRHHGGARDGCLGRAGCAAPNSACATSPCRSRPMRSGRRSKQAKAGKS